MILNAVGHLHCSGDVKFDHEEASDEDHEPRNVFVAEKDVEAGEDVAVEEGHHGEGEPGYANGWV